MKTLAIVLFALAITVSSTNATSGPAVGVYGFGFGDWFTSVVNSVLMGITLPFVSLAGFIAAFIGHPGWFNIIAELIVIFFEMPALLQYQKLA